MADPAPRMSTEPKASPPSTIAPPAGDMCPASGGFDLNGFLADPMSVMRSVDDERALFDPVLDGWQATQLDTINGIRDWTQNNCEAYFIKTGGRGLPPSTPTVLRDFFGGVWGNFWTDAPDAFAGIADTAKTLVSGAVAGALAAVEVGAELAAFAGGGAGLVVSSVLATAVEMSVNAMLGVTDEKVGVFSAGSDSGVAVMMQLVKVAQKAGDAEVQKLLADTKRLRTGAAAASMTGFQLATTRMRLEQTIADLRSRTARMRTDRSLYDDQLKKWVQLHLVPEDTQPTSVDPEKLDGAVEEVGGRETLDAEAPRGRMVPEQIGGGPFPLLAAMSPSSGKETPVIAHQVAAAKILLESAGLITGHVVTELQYGGPGTFKFKVNAADHEALRAFVDANFPEAEIDPDGDFREDCAWVTATVVVDHQGAEFLESFDIAAFPVGSYAGTKHHTL